MDVELLHEAVEAERQAQVRIIQTQGQARRILDPATSAGRSASLPARIFVTRLRRVFRFGAARTALPSQRYMTFGPSRRRRIP